ncbi:VWA domain-containing protein [Spirochaetia bacterium 38H-sp]|uniref:VWA domain-containing protein n=1 Tax=Rarispira pelagica TaxID=3141764 RepID=A0ABU9UCY9_9SPIR
MNFVFPYRLYLLLAIIPLAFILFLSSVYAWKTIKQLNKKSDEGKNAGIYIAREFVLNTFILLAFSSLVFAFSEPYWGMRPEAELTSNLDVVLAFDISRSMLAKDIGDSRLAVAKEIAIGFVNSIPAARWGVVAFKGKGSVVFPVSQDKTGAQEAIKNLSPSLFRSGGTNIAEGLSAAINAFPSQSNRKKIVIIFSDGESLSGDYASPIVKAINYRIIVYTIGVGTEEGSILENNDGSVLKNSRGEVVVSKLDKEVLMQIATSSGGQYIEVNSDKAVSQVVASISKKADITENGIRLVPAKRYYIFSMLGFLFMILYAFIRGIKWQNI